jgi:hypothetical protein
MIIPLRRAHRILYRDSASRIDHQRLLLCDRYAGRLRGGGKGGPPPLHPRPGASPLGTPK